MATQGGYDSGHVWYYYLGGRLMFPSEIRAEVEQGDYEGYLADKIREADEKPEPARSRALRDMQADLERALLSDAKRYRQVCQRVRYRRRWLGPWPDEARDMWDEPNTAAMLKHNHLFNGFANLRTIAKLSERQLELF